MPTRSCAAFGCSNNSRKTVGVTYFHPRNDIIKEKWYRSCPNGVKNIKNFYICSDHFYPNEKKIIGNKTYLWDENTLPTIWKFIS